MNAKHIMYIVYLFMIFINGVVLGSAGITLRNWQYWIIAFVPIVTYLCGYARGG